MKLEFAVKLEFQKLEFFEKIYFENFLWYSSTVKNFQNFSMVLEYHGKLDFTKFEYLKSGRSLHFSETMVDCNIVCKKMLFSYFCHYFELFDGWMV